MAGAERPHAVSAAARRRWIIAGTAALAVAVLFGGRWAAMETAERAWAATLHAGEVYNDGRDLARLIKGVVLVAGTLWGVMQLYLVYRAIGSVQVPRRLGNIEIVEAVPQRLLLGVALAAGVAYGLCLTLGTGDWWLAAALAAEPPRFDIADPILERDLGYYVASLPWSMRLQNHALLAAASAVLIVGLLYFAIGALKLDGPRPVAGPHARSHLGTLLATLALVLGWGALLDPAEVTAGAHGPLDQAALTIRLPGSTAVVVASLALAASCLAWAWHGRPNLVAGAWGLFLTTQLTVYVLGPALVRMGRGAAAGPEEQALVTERAVLERTAFGLEGLSEGTLAEFSSPGTAAAVLPLWDADRVSAAARQGRAFGDRGTPAAAALQVAEAGRPTWLVAPAPDVTAWHRLSPPPDWNEIHLGALTRAPVPLLAVETDTGLALGQAAVSDSASWFGAGFTEFALASPDTWPGVKSAGIALDGRWRRTALALALQSPELLEERGATVLLWRRDARDRLERLLPPALFDPPIPVLADGALWWVAHGYVTSNLFPLVRAPQRARPATRYLRHGFVGVVHAATGDTRIFLAPAADPVSTAWASIFTPLVRPAAELPASLAAALPFPRRAFEAAATYVAAWHGDTTSWQRRPADPFEAGPWLAQGFETARPSAFVALLAGRMTDRGTSFRLWEPAPPAPKPVTLAGSADTRPGRIRMWPAGGALFSLQGLFADPMPGAAGAGGGNPRGAAPAVQQVFVSWGVRAGDGPSAAAAVRTLLAGGAPDTTLAARWARAQQLAAQADDALARGDLEEFGRLYDALKRALGIGRAKLVPPQRPR